MHMFISEVVQESKEEPLAIPSPSPQSQRNHPSSSSGAPAPGTRTPPRASSKGRRVSSSTGRREFDSSVWGGTDCCGGYIWGGFGVQFAPPSEPLVLREIPSMTWG